MYGVTFWTYVVIAVLCAAIGILMAIKTIANHAA
jgi:hypothetical protein